jgi:hypothetical protein
VKAADQAVFPRHRTIHHLQGQVLPVQGALIPLLPPPVAGAIHPLQGLQVRHHQAAQAAVVAQQGQAAAAEAAVAEVRTAQAAAVPGEAGNNL